MSVYNTTITFGALTLNVDRLSVKKVPGTIKQVVGKRLVQREIPGRTTQDFLITIEGRHLDSSRDADRGTLEGYHDLITHTLTDGNHDGNYFVVDLSYADDGNRPTSYQFSLILIQDQ